MSSTTPFLADNSIEPDEPSMPAPTGRIGSSATTTREPVVLTPTTRSNPDATPADQEAGLAAIFRQSSHPLVLFCLYGFKIGAMATYLLSGFFPVNFVVSTVAVVVLLAMDFWNSKNVAGRRLVGLRYWNQVDDETGESFWVFESRDASQVANPVDSKMFWIALYAFPGLWFLLLIMSIIRFNISFLPIVGLAIVFNVTNAIGFTYADRDAKKRWANSVAASGWNMGLGGLGGQIIGGVVKNSVGRAFGV